MDGPSPKIIRSLHITAVFLVCMLLIGTILIPSCSSEQEIITTIDYVTVTPEIQPPNTQFTAICIMYPISPEISVVLYLLNPFEVLIPLEMEYDNRGKFFCTFQLRDLGKYSYWIEVTNDDTILQKSDTNYLWVSISPDDRDNDGMPGVWELRYALNPEDPFDASMDPDADTYSNRDEYEMGTNPLDNNFIENTIYRLRSNTDIIFLSFFAFFVLLLFSLFGLRRSRAWV